MHLRLFLVFFIIFHLLLASCSEKRDQLDNHDLWSVDKLNSIPESKKNFYLDSIKSAVNQTTNDSLKIEFLLKLSSGYYSLSNMEESRETSKMALHIAKKFKDRESEAKALFYIGDSFQFSYRDSAYYYYYQAEKIYQKNNDFSNVARMQYSKAYVLFYDGNYVACEVQVSKALQNLKNSDDYFLIYSCNSLLGNCLEKIGDFEESLNYHNTALEIIEKLDLTEREKNLYRVSTIGNISNLYDQQEKYDKSILNLQSILDENLKVNNPLSYARVLSNLAYSKFKNNEFQDVESMFLESIRIADSLGQKSDLLYKYIYFGDYYASQGDTVNAVKYIKGAKNLATENGNTNELLSTLRLLSKIDKGNSLQYSTEYIKISDNLQALQKRTRNKYARIEYETTKIQDANKELSKNNIIIIIVAIGLITLLIIFIIARYVKYKNKELQFLRKQEKASEEVYNLLTEQQQKINQAKETEKTKIAQELHDGIMNALYGIRLNLGFFNSKQDLEAVEKRKNYIEELKKVESDIRSISHNLSRNTFFDNSDFNMLLNGLIENQQGISSTRFSYISSDNSDWTDVPNIYKINLYRIIQEAILNVNKYAQAQNCIISFHRTNNIIRILIQDDGIGFDTNAKKNGIGHNNMNNRIKSLNGTINFTSEVSKGTTIEIVVDITLAQSANSKKKK